MDEKLLYEELAKDIAQQLNSYGDASFRIGLFNNEGTDKFKFAEQSTKNQYQINEVEYVPVSMQDFIGTIEPVKSVEVQRLNTNLQFAISYSSTNNHNDPREVLKIINKFASDQRARSWKLEIDGITYNVAMASAPFSNGTPPVLLNGSNYVFFDLPIYYIVSTGNIGNDNRYEISFTNDEGEEVAYELDLLTKSNARGANLVPSQEIGTVEISSITGGSAWTFEGSIFDDGSDFALLLETYIHNPPTDDPVLTFKKYKGERQVMEIKVIIDNAVENDLNGQPITMSFKFRKYKEGQIAEL